MKAIQLTEIRKLEVREVPKPSIRSDQDVLVRIERVGVCGSDVHYYTTGRIGSQVVEFPFTLGHECAGTVEAIGPAVDRVEVGQRVAIDPAVSCWSCDQCRMGRPHTCRKLHFLGCPGQIEGCLSEMIVMPQECCLPICDHMDFDQAVLSEPMAIGLYAAEQSMDLQGARVGIFGAGPIGLSVLAATQVLGAEAVYMTEKIPERIAFAEAAGVEAVWNPFKDDVVGKLRESVPGGLDVAFECAGQQETLDEAILSLRPGGKLMLIGIPEFDRYTFAADVTRRNEICIQQVRRQNECAQKTLDWMASGRLKGESMVTHHFSFDQTQEAFDLVDRYADGVIKAMISF